MGGKGASCRGLGAAGPGCSGLKIGAWGRKPEGKGNKMRSDTEEQKG